MHSSGERHPEFWILAENAYFIRGRGGGLVVSLLAFYSDDPSRIPLKPKVFSVRILFITVQRTSCLTGLDSVDLQLLTTELHTCFSNPSIKWLAVQWYFPLQRKWVFSDSGIVNWVINWLLVSTTKQIVLACSYRPRNVLSYFFIFSPKNVIN